MLSGDLIFTTNNSILLNRLRDVPAILCIQRKAKKQQVDEDSLIKANRSGFGDEIGKITNRITSMFDVLSNYKVGSKEYEELTYRITCGQHFQQNSIDAIKGIIAEPMPKTWYTKQRYKEDDTREEADIDFENSICVHRKPYFMIYIYPDLRREYNNFVKKAKVCGLFDFRQNIDEMRNLSHLTEEQQNFLEYYDAYFPVLDGNCTMNRLCHMVECEFTGYVSELKKNSNFDYSVLKSDVEYSVKSFREIKGIYEEYQAEILQMRPKNNTKSAREIYNESLVGLNEQYRQRCVEACNNKYELCNIILDLCYSTKKSKAFAWEMCGDVIIENLLRRNSGTLHYLEKDKNGTIEYQGERFAEKEMVMSDYT